ncbi:MAG: bifunctional histidine phosphatase family protein/GNAT family N-acetyltransferase [Bacillota bacterium]|nr:bifunctional histidine phosphatase family protein/GNAT family N-acetyltransferase [Bacillota bacterium]
MTKIYIIRHAEAEGNLYRIVQGHMNSYLTATGYRQLEYLAERFKDVHIDALYSSDLRRAVATAGAITKYHDVKLQKTPRLRELCMGIWEGKSFGDMAYADPEAMYNFNNNPAKWTAEGAETYSDCAERFLSAIRDIAAENEGKTVAVVSHGVVIRSALATLMGIESDEMSKKLPHGDNTAVSLLNVENGEIEVEYFNDNSHVPYELSTFAKQTWWRSDSGGKDSANLRYEVLDPSLDGKLYTKCYADSWMAAHGSLNGFVSSLYLNDAKKMCAADKGAILAAYDSENEFVGIVEMDIFRGKRQKYGWISLIYLTKENRGHGLGVQLLGMAICRFQSLGFESVRLHVSSENKRAIAFYKKHGFDIIGQDPGCGAPLYLMEKKFG